MKIFCFWILILIAFQSISAQSGNRVLVLIDNLAYKITHSQFISDLKTAGYQVTLRMVNASSNKLKEYNEFLYDHLILLCLSETGLQTFRQFFYSVDPKIIGNPEVLEFFDRGNNIILVGDVDTSQQYRQLFNSLGASLDQIGSQLVDHSKTESDIVETSNFSRNTVFSNVQQPVLYRGTGMTLTYYENHQVQNILAAEPYTISYLYESRQKGKVLNSGNNVSLVAALQGRNNARAILTGSISMFSDEFYQKSNQNNRKYVNDLIQWTFQEKGSLRVSRVFHSLQGKTEQPGEYKIKDFIRYEIDIEYYEKSKRQWVPYVADDIQLEFVMLDPYIRTTLIQSDKSIPTYHAEFQAPSVHGIYMFKVIYQRPGYSFLDSQTKVTVRPFYHNEFDRFLFQAYPYYFGVFGTLVGFTVFLMYFLYDKQSQKFD